MTGQMTKRDWAYFLSLNMYLSLPCTLMVAPPAKKKKKKEESKKGKQGYIRNQAVDRTQLDTHTFL